MRSSDFEHLNGGNAHTLRAMNKELIYNAVKARTAVSRVELVQQTNLRAPTVSRIIQELIDEDKIVCCGKGKGNVRGGPIPDLYTINTLNKYCIGLEIGHEHMVSALLNPDRSLEKVCVIEMEQDLLTDQEALLTGAERALAAAVSKVQKKNGRITAVGISCAGLVDHERGGITLSNIPSLNQTSNFSLSQWVYEKYGFPAFVDNDINLLLSACQDAESPVRKANAVMCVGICKHPGISLFTGRTLYRGAHNLAGNILLSGIPGTGEMCELLDQHLKSGMACAQIRAVIPPNTPVCAHHIRRLIQSGNPDVCECLKPLFSRIGKGLAMLQQLLDVDTILIFHPFGMEENHPLFKAIKSAFWDTVSPPYRTTEIISLPINEETFAFSAARAAFDKAYQCHT